MLTNVDRIQLVVPDRIEAARTWRALFDAEKIGDDRSTVLNSLRTTLQLGDTLVELLEPSGPGAVQDFAEHWRSGLFGVGFATANLLDMARHLDSQGVHFKEENGQLFLAPEATPGMPTTIVEASPREQIGLLSHIYEVTNPVPDWQDAAANYTRIFGLDPTRFCPIKSDLYGYRGTLTLFNPLARLDRIEITETFGGLAMDRFFRRRGSSLYMCYAETEDVPKLADRLRSNGARFSDSEDRPPETGLFVHPSALDGMLMGISRTNYAWVWSGHPELAGAGAEDYRAH